MYTDGLRRYRQLLAWARRARPRDCQHSPSGKCYCPERPAETYGQLVWPVQNTMEITTKIFQDWPGKAPNRGNKKAGESCTSIVTMSFTRTTGLNNLVIAIDECFAREHVQLHVLFILVHYYMSSIDCVPGPSTLNKVHHTHSGRFDVSRIKASRSLNLHVSS